jgi:putative ABC transport system permease protein
MSPGWLAALRIARRDAVRARGRSALIIAMIAVPVLAMTAIAVLARSAQLDTDERIARSIGAADAVVKPSHFGANPVQQHPTDDDSQVSVDERAIDGGGQLPSVASVLPRGARVLEERSHRVVVRTAAGIARAELRELDYGDPLLAGLVRQTSGRAPAGPGEVAVSPALLKRTGLRVGDDLVLDEPAARVRIVGVARPHGDTKAELALARPGAIRGLPAGAPVAAYVDVPGDLTWDAVVALNGRGYVALSRAVVLDPPPREAVPYFSNPNTYSQSGSDTLAVIIAVAVVGLGAGLEVVLLAGAAFAVGARRQSRSLALVAGTGGESRHVRSIVLAGGAVLGLAGGIAGATLGVATAAVARWPLASFAGQDFGRLDVRPLEIGAIVAFGLAIGLLAALLPARAAARVDVVAALGGRRGTVRTRRRVPVIGVLLLGGGIAAAVVGSGLALTLSTAPEEQSISTSASVIAAVLIAGGAGLAQIGLIVASPAIVGAVGRLGRFLPLAPRLAVRDAARHRSRTAPAVAAILAGVTGATALTLYVASADDADRRHYRPALPDRTASVTLSSYDTPDRVVLADADRARQVVETTLPAARVSTLVAARDCYGNQRCRSVVVDLPPQNVCPLSPYQESGATPPADVAARARNDWRCSDDVQYSSISATMLIGDAATLDALGVQPRAEAERVIAAGGVVVFDRRNVYRGRTTITAQDMAPTASGAIETVGKPQTVRVPALHATQSVAVPAALVSAATATRLGADFAPSYLLVALDRLPTTDEEDRARRALREAGVADYAFYVERGYVSGNGLVVLALLIGSAIITLGAAGVATGLAQADSRPDHATLAAVGGAPRLRRLLAMSQAGVVAGLGTALGIAAGFVPALAFIRSTPELNVVIPWSDLTVILVGIPILAAVCAGLFVRSRLPLSDGWRDWRVAHRSADRPAGGAAGSGRSALVRICDSRSAD